MTALPLTGISDGRLMPHSDAGTDLASSALFARIDRLPGCWTLWRMVVMLSLGGFFEFYELFSTAYVMPGIVRSGILTATTASFFGLNGIASYIAATFAGLFIGTLVFGSVADRCGRRAVFTYSLLWYSACAVVTAFQTDAAGLNFWRFMTGIGLGVELVTIDAYLSELVPPHMRGRAFALNQVITYLAVPSVALAAWLLVPKAPAGVDGWRWVIAAGGAGSLIVWALRRGLPESPRWLAGAGQIERAERIVARIEERVQRETGEKLPPPTSAPARPDARRGNFRELWGRHYLSRTVMLVIFHVAQAIGLYGFSHWVPTFLTQQGVSVSKSLAFTLAIAFVTPVGPLLAMAFADRIERKWQIAVSALLVAMAGLAFAQARSPIAIIGLGSVVTLGATIISLNFHAYQAELFPTRIRALAIGFVYSTSRVSGMLSGFLIAYALGHHGVPAALSLIAACMAVVALSIGLLGPKTLHRSLEELNT